MNEKALLERIEINSKIMGGKPVIKGTRLTVEFILKLLANGATIEEILKEYKGDLFIKMFPNNFPGPVGLIQKDASENIKQIAADMMISYTKFDSGEIIIGDKIYKAYKKDKKEFSKYLV